MAKFHSMPCATCGTDTMHVNMRCNHCGEIFITAHQATQEAYRKIRARAYTNKGPRGAFLYLKRLHKEANAATRNHAEETGTRHVDIKTDKYGFNIPKKKF